MAILGIGIDIVNLSRIELIIAKKILAKNELLTYSTLKLEARKKEFIGGRFALKEAIVKAFNYKLLQFNKVDIISDGPLYLNKNTSIYLNSIKNFKNIHLSMSHEQNIAIGIVIIEK